MHERESKKKNKLGQLYPGPLVGVTKFMDQCFGRFLHSRRLSYTAIALRFAGLKYLISRATPGFKWLGDFTALGRDPQKKETMELHIYSGRTIYFSTTCMCFTFHSNVRSMQSAVQCL